MRSNGEFVEPPFLEIFQLDTVLSSWPLVTLLEQGVGLDELQGSLPTQPHLFCDSESSLITQKSFDFV